MKTVYLTWHYTTHGVAYLKHILSEFFIQGKIPEHINMLGLDQTQLNETFDLENQKKGFIFDKVIYLVANQSAFDKLSSRRFAYINTILEDELVKSEGLAEVWSKIIELPICYSLENELKFVERNYPEKLIPFKQLIWRNIQHYPIEEQIRWLKSLSNFKNAYTDEFEAIQLNVDDLRNEKQIADEVSKWARKFFKNHKDVQTIINVSLGSSETQVVWHILAESGQLPENTRFIKTYDDKSDRQEERFKKFSIQEVPTNLVSSIGADFKIFRETQSPSRDLVNRKMKIFLESGFSILLLGERGIGKSQIASEAKKAFHSNIPIPLKEANCASFDDDSKAEAELFGYEKGAFTGANKVKKGLLEEANGGILFLDEIHHLSKLVQAKLMKALQTDSKNQMSIRRLGSNDEIKVECRLIFASNKSIRELRVGECALLPDFYDRIVQHVISIPPLRDTYEDREKDWTTTWEHLRFGKRENAPAEKELVDWLKQLPLYGNYRDLQKIAMYYNAFNKFDDQMKNLLEEKSPFQYAKSEFEKYHSPIASGENDKFNFDERKTTKEMIADYQYELQDWAVRRFNGRKSAIEHFGSLKDTVSEKTFNDWKNRKSLNK
jgi:transcriptional regulator with AAA-type ATPase domain